ncbi:MAG: glycosyltransferase [Candidatus Omnitrophota bacterium]
MDPHIAVAIPCCNEETTIREVIRDFKQALPDAAIHVFDNNSNDHSVQYASEEGAVIHMVPCRGKGRVMRKIFDSIRADALIIVDGDGTYVASEAHLLIKPVLEGKAEMTVGNRLEHAGREALAKMHLFGNHLIVKTINLAFGTSFQDVLSGYRCLSHKCCLEIPLLTSGFEVETELTLQALEEGLTILEIPVSYRPRPKNSRSKLRPFADGWKILLTIAKLLRDHQPLRVYTLMALILFCLGGLFAAARLLLWSLLMILTAVVLGAVGLVLSAIGTRFRELRQILGRQWREEHP